MAVYFLSLFEAIMLQQFNVDPCVQSAMFQALQRLNDTLKSPVTNKDKARRFLKKIVQAMHSLYMQIHTQATTSPPEQIALNRALAYKSLESKMENKPFESIYLEFNILLSECMNLNKALQKSNQPQEAGSVDYLRNETRILIKAIQDLITPFLKPMFTKIKNFYSFKENGLGYVIAQFSVKDAPEYKKAEEVLKKYSVLYDLIQGKKEVVCRYGKPSIKDTLSSFPLLESKLQLLCHMIMLIELPLRSKPIDPLDQIEPLWEMILLHLQEIARIGDCLDAMKDTFDTLLVQASLLDMIQDFRAMISEESSLVRASPISIPATASLKAAAAASVCTNSMTEETAPTASIAACHVDSPDSSSLASESQAATERADELYAQAHPYPVEDIDPGIYTRWPKPVQFSATDESAKIPAKSIPITGTIKKTVIKIFENSPKIKYDKLVTLIEALSGELNDKTGSSSRKFHLFDMSVFMHERHGRDRAQYVDGHVVKQMKILLSSLGISRDNLNLQLNISGDQLITQSTESEKPKKRK